MKIMVLNGYTKNPGDLSWGDLERLGEATVYGRTPPELVVKRIGDVEATLTNKVAVTEEVLRQCRNIRYIGVLATGYDVVDTAVASARGIMVCSIPSYGTDAVGQYTIALLLKICHHVGHHAEAVEQGVWSANEDWCFWDYPLIELASRTMGIIGYGCIDGTTGWIAQTLGMKVLAYEGEERAEQEEELVSLEMLLTQSDVISLCCPLFPSAEGVIDRGTIGKTKDGVILLNGSRGPLIVEQDLADALNYEKMYAAGLDMMSTEPIRSDNPLFEAKNCLVTPHIAWAPEESRQRLIDVAVGNLYNFQVGEPVSVVNG